MKIELNDAEKKAISELNLGFDVSGDITDDQFFALSSSVADAASFYFDVNYHQTAKGKIYDDIMDKIANAE